MLVLEEIDDEADAFGWYLTIHFTMQIFSRACETLRVGSSSVMMMMLLFTRSGIDMVKVTDGEIAADFGIMTTPTLAYFRRGHALIYEGDLMDAASILGWITSNEAFQLKDEIELVNRRMLDKILEEQEFVAVYFCECDCILWNI